MKPEKQFRFAFSLQQEAATAEEAEILIYSAISNWKYGPEDPDVTAQEFDGLIKAAKRSGAVTLRLRLNCPGGNVAQAVAMKAILENSKFENIRIDIEGLCASAATFFVCVPGARVRIAQGSEFMIHNPAAYCWGNASDFQRAAARLEKMQNDQHEMYAQRTGQTPEQIGAWMDAETWFTAKETVEYGFADELLEAAPVAAAADADTYQLMQECYGKLPKEISARRGKPDTGNAETPVASNSAPEHTQETPSKEENSLEIHEITMQQLQEGNSALYQDIFRRGQEAERQRMQDIDDLCAEGYEAMAQEAKEKGTSAADFVRQMTAAQKKKKADYLSAREKETATTAQVKGGAAGEQTPEDDAAALKKLKEESAAYAKECIGSGSRMY